MSCQNCNGPYDEEFVLEMLGRKGEEEGEGGERQSGGDSCSFKRTSR